MPAPNPASLTSSFDHQEDFFARAFGVINHAIAQRAFPCASVAVTHAGKLVALKSFGNFVFPEDVDIPPGLERPARVSTIFDIASLTKPVATTTMAMILCERGRLDLNQPVAEIVPEFLIDSSGMSDPRRAAVTFQGLLAHSSGLPAYEKLFLKARTRDELLHAAFTMPLAADPGSRAEYSDIGFIVLGVALERIAAESLDTFCEREIFRPLAMEGTSFHPAAGVSAGKRRAEIPPTADERARKESGGVRSTFRNRIIQGEVQDENAFVLGGVAAHAGLFATAHDLARFAHFMLVGGSSIVGRESISRFTLRESSPAGTSRTLGWDTPSALSQSGKYFGPRSYGHLGYTGTSLWIDPDRELSVALLTNRTWPDCSNPAIKQVRPQFHDAVVEALERQR